MARMSEQTEPQTDTATEATPKPGFGVVSSIRKYVGEEDGSAKAVLQPTGAAGVRITLIGEKNGVLADRVVAALDESEDVVAGIEGLERGEWDRELTSKATVTPKHWRKMAGWVAHQKRFPKARNRKVVDYR